ncbi:MAG: hypothetical protein M3251_04570 [Thermoproteota archaeon]|nr:hypothetical protein [Thermoproteota archaeon]
MKKLSQGLQGMARKSTTRSLGDAAFGEIVIIAILWEEMPVQSRCQEKRILQKRSSLFFDITNPLTFQRFNFRI